MKCLDCDYLDSKVIESRDVDDGGNIRRRRQCLRCGYRFTTYERAEMPNLVVRKKDGRRELFDRDKVATGIYRACEKRPVSIELVSEVIAQIEREVRSRGESEVASDAIGELVMAKLMALDDVAYVRFASVYRSFTDLGAFEAEVSRLRQNNAP